MTRLIPFAAPQAYSVTPPAQVKAGEVVRKFLLDHGMKLPNEKKTIRRSSRKDGKSPARYMVYVCENISPLIHLFSVLHLLRFQYSIQPAKLSADFANQCRSYRFHPDTRTRACRTYAPPDMGYGTTSLCESSSLSFSAHLRL